MSSMVVLERHLWLTMTELKEADKVPFLDVPVLSNSHFGPAVEGFVECFTEAPKSSQAMRHFLPKCASSSAASSRPKPALTQQPAKPMPATPEPRSHKDRKDRGRSRSAGRYPFPKRQEPRPKIALDPAPQKSCWSARQKEEGLLVPHGPTLAPGRPTAVIADKIKHIHFKKESKYPLLPTISVLPLCSHSLELFQPLATWAEAWRAIPGVSEWVMATIRWGYTLQFALRPPRFRGVLATIVHSKDAQVLCAEVINLLEKEAIEIVRPAQSKSGFYSLYFLIPPKRRWPATYSRFQTPESREIHILEIHIRGDGVSIQGPPVWTVPSSLHFYAMHGCGSLPSVTDGNLHPPLPRRLAQSEEVSTSHKSLLLSHLCCLGLRVNFAKSTLSPSQRVSFLGTVID